MLILAIENLKPVSFLQELSLFMAKGCEAVFQVFVALLLIGIFFRLSFPPGDNVIVRIPLIFSRTSLYRTPYCFPVTFV